MIVRIPSQELGNFLNSLNAEMKFLHFRNISAQDVSINLMVSEMEKERLKSTNLKLDKLNEEKGKVSEKMKVVESMDKNDSQTNLQNYSNLKMQDEIAFSTVSLYLSGKEKLAQTQIINSKKFQENFEPKFSYKAKNAIQNGFFIFQSFCIGILYLWPFWILAIIAFWIFKKHLWFKK